MKTESEGRPIAPTRVLEMLEARYGAFAALASATLADMNPDPEMCPPLDTRTALAILEFADDLKQAGAAAERWMELRNREMENMEAILDKLGIRRPEPPRE